MFCAVVPKACLSFKKKAGRKFYARSQLCVSSFAIEKEGKRKEGLNKWGRRNRREDNMVLSSS